MTLACKIERRFENRKFVVWADAVEFRRGFF
jgi:hypothetical protein